MECGGNLFDAVSLAVKSALYTTEIPTVKVATMDGDQPELELSDDPFDTKRLVTQNAPCLLKVTIYIMVLLIQNFERSNMIINSVQDKRNQQF